MRVTPSRFSDFVASIDPDFDTRPVPGARPANTRPRDLEPDNLAPELSILERRHPAVIQTLQLLWGYPEMNQFFEKVHTGCDPSLNFAPDAMAELMVLASLHRRVCPHRPAKPVQELYGAGRWADPWKPARSRG